MRYELKQIFCRPWTLNGFSLQLIESHYENNYGGALRRLNAITEQLEARDWAKTPAHVINGLKREELIALNSTLLHELYFASMGGEGRVTPKMSEVLARDFGSYQQWRTQFTSMGYALGGGSGWVMFGYNLHTREIENYWMADHAHGPTSVLPLLVMDMYEHSYQMDFGAAAAKYIDAFFSNINWDVVTARLESARKADLKA